MLLIDERGAVSGGCSGGVHGAGRERRRAGRSRRRVDGPSPLGGRGALDGDRVGSMLRMLAKGSTDGPPPGGIAEARRTVRLAWLLRWGCARGGHGAARRHACTWSRVG